MESGNTTIGIIATNAKLSKAQANKTAQLAQNALARRIVPAHTAFDGDTIFVMATGEIESDITLGEFLPSKRWKSNHQRNQ